MSDGAEVVAARVAELRREFDGSFAAPPRRAATGQLRLLLVGVGGLRLAVRLAQLQALEAMPTCVPLPGAPPELMGLVGLRGRLVPAFSLARLLGEEAAGEARWLLLAGGEEPVGLAVDGFHGQVEVTPSEVCLAGREQARPHLPEFVRVQGAVCGLVDLPSLVAAIGRRAGGPVEES